MGSVRAGKTTLLQQLTKRGTLDRRKEVEMGFNGEPLSTVGVDLGDWVYRPQKGSPKVTFMTWDFGGQEEYYATHQCFLSDRSLYLVVWDANDGKKGLEAIKPWLENIEARAPGAPVIVVGTHSDCINQDEKKRLEELFEQWYINYDPSQFAYPSIEPSCQFVNCFDPLNTNELVSCPMLHLAIMWTHSMLPCGPIHVALWTHSMLPCGPIPCCPVDPFHVALWTHSMHSTIPSTQGLPMGGSKPHPLPSWMNQFQCHS
eukprot:Em0020g1007a